MIIWKVKKPCQYWRKNSFTRNFSGNCTSPSKGWEAGRQTSGGGSAEFLSSLTNDFQEFIKQIGAVLGAWGALWMVLYTESPVPDTLNTFNRSIQQIDMGNRKRSISQALFFDGIGMILRCDLDFSCLKIFYRMIAAAVAEFELVGSGTVGKG